MAVIKEVYLQIKAELDAKNVTLVAVSKTKPVSDIMELYELGQRDFGENYVQELVEKAEQLPKDIRWHFIGHLQSNKVKYIAPFVHLIHGVDSERLLKEINKQAAKLNKTIDVLLQIHIAKEETKFGLDEEELNLIMSQFENLKMENIRVCGLMGMASFSEDMDLVRKEFQYLKHLFNHYSNLQILSMGMSGDYKIAMEEGSTMVRIGSLLFGARNYEK
jgi:pyridoxal phosphate enzyme (YggS family)